jgi:hypothetical protein
VRFPSSLRSGLAVVAVLLAVSPTAHAFDPTEDRESHLLSRSIAGGFPNGPSRNGAFSQDGQGTSLAAFESDASDLIANDPNGLTDVFLVRRGGHFTPKTGEPWQPVETGTELVSVAYTGGPANGRSYLPDIDGSALHRDPHCIAFISEASNLVPGDTNGKPDGFVRDVKTGKTTRVSVATGGKNGKQSNGTTYDVQIDGACSRVAFTSDATNLFLPKSKARKNKFLKPLTTAKPPAGTKQVYVRMLGGLKDNEHLGGTTWLASASKKQIPGNASSYDVSFGQIGDGCPKHCGTTSGTSLSFTSDATNLVPGVDTNGQPDIYQRDFFKPVLNYKQRRAGKKATLDMKTFLVSANTAGKAGNGASTHPASNDSGEYVAFETTATDLVPNDVNNASDVVMRGMLPTSNKRMWHVSNALETGQANGASHDPTITSPGSILFYESDASNLQPNPPRTEGIFYDRNCMRDVFFWNYVSTNASLQSRNSNQEILNLPENSGGRTSDTCPPTIAKGSINPVSSYYGNYFLFESAYPLIELPLADRALPTILKTFIGAATRSHEDPNLHQVYLRYNGPKHEHAVFPPSEWPLPEPGTGSPGGIPIDLPVDLPRRG